MTVADRFPTMFKLPKKGLIIFLLVVFISVKTYMNNKNLKRKAKVTTKADNTHRNLQSQRSPAGHTCLINIHGLHHSGTGTLRRAIVQAMGPELISEHVDTKAINDEGQHIQSVYPSFVDRLNDPTICGVKTHLTRKLGRLYYCPELLDTVDDIKKKFTLFKDWSKHWDMSKPYLVQKTPTMDVALLEQLKVTPTFHAIIMRHPLRWFKEGIREINLPIIWLDVWSHTLEQILEKDIQNFAVINYEMMVTAPNEVLPELHDMITMECLSGRRASEIENHDNLAKYGVTPGPITTWDSKEDFFDEQNIVREKSLWFKCNRDAHCRELMNELSPYMSKFGYSWDPDNFFLPNELKPGSKILFSSHNLPSLDFVKKMKSLAWKYTSAGNKEKLTKT